MSWNTRDSLTHIFSSPVAIVDNNVVAGGAGDAVEVDGLTIDLQALTESPQEITVVLFGVTTLAATETLQFTANWQQASDTGFTTDVTDVTDGDVLTNATAVTGAATAGTFSARLALNLQLVEQRFIRLQYTPNISTAMTDTADIQGAYLIGGSQVHPRVPAVGAGASA